MLILPPLIHTSALMPTFTALLAGNAVIYDPKFDAARTWQLVARHRPTAMVITGDAMGRPLVEALRADAVDTSSLSVVASGAALFSGSVKDAFFEVLPDLLISDSVGSSETGFGESVSPRRASTSGAARRWAGTVTRWSWTTRTGCRRRGPAPRAGWRKIGPVPLGYYNDPARSAEIFREVHTEAGPARAVVTGDRARIEDDGSVTLLGRGNMVINTGGEKVFAEEVEAVVKAHPDVYDAIVVGVPDERWGSRVAVVMRARAGLPDFEGIEKHAPEPAGRLQDSRGPSGSCPRSSGRPAESRSTDGPATTRPPTHPHRSGKPLRRDGFR